MVALQPIENYLPGIAKDLGHFRLEARIQAKHVMVDQELPVRIGSGTETHDDAIFSLFGNEFAQSIRDHFQQDHECPGFFKRFGIIENLFGQCGIFALHSEPAQRRHRLRGEPQMPNSRDACIDNAPDAAGHGRAAFQLNGVTTGLSHKPPGIADGSFDRRLVRHVRHIAYDERSWRAAAYRLAVPNHVIHRHGQRAFIAKHGHTQAVTHQNHLDPGLFL